MNNFLQVTSERQIQEQTEKRTRVEVKERSTVDNSKKYAHYVNNGKLVESVMYNKPVIALCGKKWIPNKILDDAEICPVCKSLYELLD